jgi:hypothetical protein
LVRTGHLYEVDKYVPRSREEIEYVDNIMKKIRERKRRESIERKVRLL